MPSTIQSLRWSATVAALVAIALPATTVAQGDDDWSVYWKNGTRIESSDGEFKIKLGGRIQADFSFADPDRELEQSLTFEDGTEFRRARLFVEGLIYERVEFKAQYDFAGGDAAFKDVYVGLVDLPVVGNLRIGHFKEPFSLEELTSSKYISFLERSFPVEAFSPSRNMGMMFHRAVAEDRITWAAGLFKDTDDFGTSLSDEWNVTGRVTGLPWYREEGESLLHVGLGVSRRSPIDDQARFRARPQAHLSPRLVDTGNLMAEGADLLGLEVALVEGPFWAQAEWIRASLDSPADADLGGFYVQAGWFLTGESRAYKAGEGVFDRIKPTRNFLAGEGLGAWEIAVRYSDLDLEDATVLGGQQDGLGLAVNWYLNPASRVMLDYVTTDLDNGRGSGGTADFILLRLQVDF